MAPLGSRKRIKPSPPGPGSQPTTQTPDDPAATDPEQLTSQKQGSKANWYPTPWSTVSKASKAAPVTEVARESISVPRNVASTFKSPSTSHLDSPKIHRHPSIQLTKKEGAYARSLPASATTTCVNIASNGSASTAALETPLESVGPATQQTDKTESIETATGSADDLVKKGPDTKAETAPSHVGVNGAEPGNAATDQARGWFSWFYGPPTTEKNTSIETAPPEAPTPSEACAENQISQPDNVEPENTPLGEQTKTTENSDTTEEQRRSWYLNMWYGASSSSKGLEQPDKEAPKTEDPTNERPTVDEPTYSPPTLPQEADKPTESDNSSQVRVENARASGWSSYWFRDAKDSAEGKTQDVKPAEASVTRDSSQQQLNLEPEQQVEISKKGSVKAKQPTITPGQAAPVLETPPPELSPPKVSEATASKHLQSILPNQVLPQFKDTYALEESPSFLQSIGRFLHYSKAPNNKHVYMIKDPPRIRRALAIGIHGYFPAPLIRSVLGQPTGTSIRFSNTAANAIRKWTESHGHTCDIEKIALEGEGRISERVDLLWKLLLNWMEEIRKADFIMVACHSQGVPVAIMLIAKLISFGCLNATRVGICAMAGVNLGPFPDYRSRWISGSAGELFDFALPFSQVTRDYEVAMKSALDFGVRITYVGSIDDQLVSLESALFSPIAHPYVYRAVFVDGRVHAPSFLSHLVGFALKLRNLGIPDHGLIRELSSPLAGSLYTGEGHSRLYDDEAVYSLAIEFTLETSHVSGAHLDINRSRPPAAMNPYILPFAMRGLLEEEYVRKELYEETVELLKQFDNWKPSTKVLKDVKFRLEGIRSKL